MTYLVQVHEERFRVDDDQIAQIRADIEAAVRAGGALVSIAHDSQVTDVLVAAGSSIRIDKTGDLHPVSTASDGPWHAQAGFDDFAIEA